MQNRTLKRQGLGVLWAAGWVLGSSSLLWAGGAGTTGASFLTIGTSARGESLAGAYIAAVEDVDAAGGNPAGLSRVKKASVGLTHLEWFEGIRYEYLSYADRYASIGSIGIGLGYFHFGDIPKTLETASGDYDPVNSGGSYGASDLALTLALAGHLGIPEHRVGAAVKIIQETIDVNSSFSLALDLGDQWLISEMPWYQKSLTESLWTRLIPGTVGLAVRNLGTPVKFIRQSDSLPILAGLGVEYSLWGKNIFLNLEGDYHPAEARFSTHAGVEGLIHGAEALDFALRAGYQTGAADGSGPGISLGAGMVFSNWTLDYAFVPYGDLGTTHRISLKFSWGEGFPEKEEPAAKPSAGGNAESMQDLNLTAQQMMRSKRSIESKGTVAKTEEPQTAMAKLEARRPSEQSLHLEAKNSALPQTVLTPKTKPGETLGSKDFSSKSYTSRNEQELIAQITRSKSAVKNQRDVSHYARRTQEDAVRAAVHETENETAAFDSVETEAKQEASNRQSTQSGEAVITKTTVYFGANSSKLNRNYFFALDQIANTFDKYPTRTILVQGYTSGDELNGQVLSTQRAQAVKDYLVQVKSIPNGQVSARGFADKDPQGDNATSKGRAMNRRVRVTVIQSGN